MSTETTPAVLRATAVIADALSPEPSQRHADRLARAALEAALEDTDDSIKQAISAADGRLQGRIAPSWEALSEQGKAYYSFHLEALRAVLIGSDQGLGELPQHDPHGCGDPSCDC